VRSAKWSWWETTIGSENFVVVRFVMREEGWSNRFQPLGNPIRLRLFAAPSEE
jgi:hypothetical protein